jgi:hypothetical protein
MCSDLEDDDIYLMHAELVLTSAGSNLELRKE